MGRCAVAVLAAALVVGGCGSTSGAPPSAPAPNAERTTVRVTNNNWSDVRVYLVYGGQRVRLGSVTSMQTREFPVPPAYARAAGPVQLLVHPMASSERYLSEAIALRQGQRADLTVQNHLAISSLAVRSW